MKDQQANIEKQLSRKLREFSLRTESRTDSIEQRERENTLKDMSEFFDLAALNIADDPTSVLRLDAICLLNEYEVMATDEILDPKTKEARLNSLDECLVDNLYAQENTNQVLQRPDEYRDRLKEVYGPHRKIKFPPSGDRARKYVDAQVRRLSSRDSHMHSPAEREMLRSRQAALKSFAKHYIELQCKALDLKVLEKEKSKSKELEM